MDEFTIISQYFNRHTQHPLLKKGIGDDCAILTPSPAEDWLFTIDTLNVGIHFVPEVDPFDLGHKALAVSLSDIAAMGGNPRWFMLSLTLPEAQTTWLEKFSEGLFNLADRFQVQLIGGDTTRGHLAVTTQVIGTIPYGEALCRNGAAVGDDIYITGNLGDAALALKVLRKEVVLSAEDQLIIMQKLNRPEPRVEIGIKLRSFASAAIDVSDGLVADLQHILDQSKLGATINWDAIPLSEPLKKNISMPVLMELALTQGDDYELCFTANPSYRDYIQKLNIASHCNIQRIGVIESRLGLRFLSQGQPVALKSTGYRHF